MSAVRYWAIVPAAGSGRRFGSELPKQFQRLGDKLVAEHSLSRLLAIQSIEKIIVPCDLAVSQWSEIPAASDARVERVAGGAERVHSVLQGLHAIRDRADDNDWVLVHDMARPCITSADINRLVDQLRDNDVGGILAAPVSDTLKRVAAKRMDEKRMAANNEPASELIEATVDRSLFRAAQTPQMFRYGILLQALQTMLADGQTPTDEASAVEYLGRPVAIVQGRRDNIKITHREDLVIAAAIMRYQETEQCE